MLLLLKISCVYRVVAVAAVVVVIYSVGVHSGGSHCIAAVQLLNDRTQLLQALLKVLRWHQRDLTSAAAAPVVAAADSRYWAT